MSQKNGQPKRPALFRLFTTGFLMGSADLVPGVSGGTVAFIAGIYEELLTAIKRITGEVPRLLLTGKFKEAWRAIPISFLLPLFTGIFTAIFSLAGLLAYLLDKQAVYTWSLFFGLITASIYIVTKRVKVWDVQRASAALVAAAATFLLVGAVPVETAATLMLFLLSGAVAACAMILPGISGSFILLILGKYDQVLQAVTERNFLIVGAVALGALLGLAAFARLLSWVFARYHDWAIAVLVGVMLGSLRKVWPWREVVQTRTSSSGEIVPIVEQNVLPAALNIELLLAILLMAFGVWLVIRLEQRNALVEHTEDIAPDSTK